MAASSGHDGFRITYRSGCVRTSWNSLVVTISAQGLVVRVLIEITDYVIFRKPCWASLDASAAAFQPTMAALEIRFRSRIGPIARRTLALQTADAMPQLQQMGKLKWVICMTDKLPMYLVDFDPNLSNGQDQTTTEGMYVVDAFINVPLTIGLYAVQQPLKELAQPNFYFL